MENASYDSLEMFRLSSVQLFLRSQLTQKDSHNKQNTSPNLHVKKKKQNVNKQNTKNSQNQFECDLLTGEVETPRLCALKVGSVT